MKKLKVLSLFNGMNCIGMALKSLNIEAELYCSEIDKYANKISSLLFPEAVNLGCVKTVKVEDIGKIDLLVAGSPCQGFSFAGKQLNFEDERSKLFFEFIRILEEARKLNPEVKFLLENVKMSKEHQAVISRFCGIDCIEINSALLSAQNRRRLYWTNIGTNKNNLFGIEQVGIKQPADKGILLKDILEETAAEKYCLNIEYFTFLYKRLKRKYILTDRKGNLKKHQNKAGALSVGGHGSGNHSDMDIVTIPKAKQSRRLTPLECCRLQTIPEEETKKILSSSISDSQIYKMLGNGWTVSVIAYILKHL